MKGIAVLGSTGTIGTQTLSILAEKTESFRVISLAAGRNVDLLKAQIRKFRPERVSVSDDDSARLLRAEFPEVAFFVGSEGLEACVDDSQVDIVIMGIVGFAALAPTLKAIQLGKQVGLANKESLVVAGSLLRKEVAKSSARLIPVDSEHNALFQLLEAHPREDVRTLVLTASGGPLLRLPDFPLEEVTPSLAVRHPNWKMGPKISVDSATLMNKGLELIEAHFLFDFPESAIEIWIHPQSMVHGAIWMSDNSCFFQVSRPDMRLSIGHALSYPKRLEHVIPKLTLREMAQLEFFEPDTRRFPAISLARRALEAGPGCLVALNAANEVAVAGFLGGQILFSDMAGVIEETLSKNRTQGVDSIEHIIELDKESRELSSSFVRARLRR